MEINDSMLEKLCKTVDKLLTREEARQELERQHAHRLKQFSMRTWKGGVVGGAWDGTGSPGDSDDMKRLFSEWVRAVRVGRPLPDSPEFVTRALSEGSNTAGGYLVPEEFIPELLRLIEESGVMRKLVRVVTMNTKTSNLSSLTTGMSVYWPAELQEITQSDPVFGRPVLESKKLAALTSASGELDEDSGIELADLLMQLFAEAIADEEDRVILQGNADPFDGVLFESGVNQSTMGAGMTDFSDVTFNDVNSVIDSITSRAQRNARFFVHRTVLGLLRGVRDLNHRYIWSPPEGGDPPTIWSFPYTLSDQMPSTSDTAVSTNFLAFGDPKNIILGDRKRLTLAVSGDAGFKNDEVFYRVVERIAVLSPAIPASFARLRTAAS